VDVFGLVYSTSLLAIGLIAAVHLWRDERIYISWVPIAAIIGTYIVTTGQVPFTDIRIDWLSALSGAQYVLDTSLQSLSEAYKAFEGSTDMAAGTDFATTLAHSLMRGARLAGKFLLGDGGPLWFKLLSVFVGIGDYITSLLYEAYAFSISLLGLASLALYLLKYILMPQIAGAFIAIGGIVIAARPDRVNNVVAGLTIMFIPVVLSFAVAVVPPLQLSPQSSSTPFFQNLVYYKYGDPLVLILQNEELNRLVALFQDSAATPVANKTGETYYVKAWVWAGLDIEQYVHWKLDWIRGEYYNGTLPQAIDDTFEKWVAVPIHIPPAKVNYTSGNPIGSYSPVIEQKRVEYFDCAEDQCPHRFLPVRFVGWTFAYIPQYDYSGYSWQVSSNIVHNVTKKVAWLSGTVYYYCYGYAYECSISVWLNPIASPETSLVIESIEKSDYVGYVSLQLLNYDWLGVHSKDFEKIMSDLKSRNFTLPIPPDPNITQVVKPIREHLREVQNYTWAEPHQYRLHLSISADPKIECEQVGNSTVCYEVPAERRVQIKWSIKPVNYTPTPPPFFWIAPPPYEEFNRSLTLLMLSSLIYGDEELKNVYYLAYGQLFNKSSGGAQPGSGFIIPLPIEINFGMPQLSLWPFYSPSSLGYCKAAPAQSLFSNLLAQAIMFFIGPVCDLSMKVLTFYNTLVANLLTAASLLGVIGAVLGTKGRYHGKLIGGAIGEAQRALYESMAPRMLPKPPLSLPSKYTSKLPQRAAALLRGATTMGERAKYAAAYALALFAHYTVTFIQLAASTTVFQSLTRIALLFGEGIILPSRRAYEKLGGDRWEKIEYAAYMVAAVADVNYLHFLDAMMHSIGRRMGDALAGMKAMYGWPGVFFLLRHPLSARANHARVIGGILNAPLIKPPALPFVNYGQLANYLKARIAWHQLRLKRMGLPQADPAHVAAAIYIARAYGIKDPLQLLQGDAGQLIAEIVKRGWGPGHGAVAAWALGVAKGADASPALKAALRWSEVAAATARYDPDRLMNMAAAGAEAAKRGVISEAELGVLAGLALGGINFSRSLASLGANNALAIAAKAPDLFEEVYGQAVTTRAPIDVIGLASSVAVIDAIRHNPAAVYALHPRDEVALLAALQIRGGNDPFGHGTDWAKDAISNFRQYNITSIRDMLASLNPAGGNAEALLHIINAAERGVAPELAPEPTPVASALVSKAARGLIDAEPAVARLWAKAALSREGYSVDEVRALLSSPPPVLAGEAAKEAARLSIRYEVESKLRAGMDINDVMAEMSNAAASALNNFLSMPAAPAPPAPAPIAPTPPQLQLPALPQQQQTPAQQIQLQQGAQSQDMGQPPTHVQLLPQQQPGGVLQTQQPLQQQQPPQLQAGQPAPAQPQPLETSRAEGAQPAPQAPPPLQPDQLQSPVRQELQANAQPHQPQPPPAPSQSVAGSIEKLQTAQRENAPPPPAHQPLHQPPSATPQPQADTQQAQQPPAPPAQLPQPRQLPGPRDLTGITPPPVQYVEDDMLRRLKEMHEVATMPARTADEERGRELLLSYYHIIQDDLQNAVRYAQPWIEVTSPKTVTDFIKLLKAEGIEVKELSPASLVPYAYNMLMKEAGVKSVEEALKADVGDNEKLKKAQEVLREFVSKVQEHAEKYYKSKKPDGDFHRIL